MDTIREHQAHAHTRAYQQFETLLLRSLHKSKTNCCSYQHHLFALPNIWAVLALQSISQRCVSIRMNEERHVLFHFSLAVCASWKTTFKSITKAKVAYTTLIQCECDRKPRFGFLPATIWLICVLYLVLTNSRWIKIQCTKKRYFGFLSQPPGKRNSFMKRNSWLIKKLSLFHIIRVYPASVQ